MRIHLGIDDADSRRGMCTTYLAVLIANSLIKRGAKFFDYPNLIRLNPNIPWKTRGNGAVALRFDYDDVEDAFNIAKSLVSKYAEKGASNPCIVLVNHVSEDLKSFARLGLFRLIRKKDAEKMAKKHDALVYCQGSGRGIVGALCAIGNTLNKDFTYELLVYRGLSKKDKVRRIDRDSVIKMSIETYPYTFNNYDEEKDRILITPHGPDPVLLGIRGESPDILLKALSIIKIYEDYEMYAIFRSNQGTGEHLRNRLSLKELKPFNAGYFVAKVCKEPRMIEGGHVVFEVENDEGIARCMVYEPASKLRFTTLSLIKGDIIEVGGGVRKASKKHTRVINVEYIKPINLVKEARKNPICHGKRMKSLGRDKGFRCEVCGKRLGINAKITEKIERDLEEGKVYLPPPRSQRHLTKPLQRYGLEKSNGAIKLVDNWIFVKS